MRHIALTTSFKSKTGCLRKVMRLQNLSCVLKQKSEIRRMSRLIRLQFCINLHLAIQIRYPECRNDCLVNVSKINFNHNSSRNVTVTLPINKNSNATQSIILGVFYLNKCILNNMRRKQ